MQSEVFRSRYGPWALVAGGSEGLGAEWARQIAARGVNLVLVAERADPLEAFAAELARTSAVETRAVVADLARPDVMEILAPYTGALEIGLLVYNAAHSVIGPFLGVPLAEKLRTLDVNCRGALVLLDAFAPGMVERGRGGILLVSSLAGLQGSALVGTYAATKAFDQVLGESLWEELRGAGVDVLALVAGATRTPGYERSRPRRAGAFAPPLADPAAVVAEGLAALGRGPSRVAGRRNRMLGAVLQRLLPRRTAVRLMGRALRAQYGEPGR